MRRLTLICVLLLAQLPLVATADWKGEAPAQIGWQYSQREDEMGRGTAYTALLFSANCVDFSFPYESGQPGVLVVTRLPKTAGSGAWRMVILMAKGQFSSYASEYVTVQFDGGSLQQFTIGNVPNSKNNGIFIKDVAGFVRQLRRSSHVKIEATFYNDGVRVFEFDVQGLTTPWW
jgi:hypothetical protein